MTKKNSKNWSDLEVFADKGIWQRGEPKIRILKEGTFIFNVSLVQKAKLELYTHTVLSYSKSNKAIVFDFVKNDNRPGALKITQRTKEGTGSCSITSKSFFTINHFLNKFKIS